MNLKTSLKTPLTRTAFAAALCLLGLPSVTSAAVLFSDNFNVNSSASWTVNVAPAANASQQSATWAFNYADYGIPAAPGSGDTLGLRLRANVPGSAASPVTTRPAQATSGLSVSPTGMNFGTSYHMTFYVWANFFGSGAGGLADNGGSEGGTQNILFAVGTSGTVPLVVGNTTLVSGGQMDGIGFATTGDGGITSDYRVYPKSGTISPAGAVYAAGGSANTLSYYTSLFPSVTAPAVQQTISQSEFADAGGNTQAGSTQAGSFGFAWHYVDILKDGNSVTWNVDGTNIATLSDISGLGALGGNNIALGQSDVNGSTARHPSLEFTVYDNLVVTDIPEPAAIALTGAGLAVLVGLSRRRKK